MKITLAREQTGGALGARNTIALAHGGDLLGTMPLIPTATYRLQFHHAFTFSHARALVPYLAGLGISHVYASPIFRAAPGSMHGYDVCDHNALNPELGSRADFDAFSAALKSHGLGLMVDFVPNHMGIERALNPWWRDVLENGQSSVYARFFDIDWHPLKTELSDRVLLPVLGEQYGRVLEDGGFRVEFAGGDLLLRHGEFSLPLEPRSTLPLLRASAQSLPAAPAEFESILTALEHLPAHTETAAERMAERVRERQIIRERLVRVCREVPEVAAAIAATVAKLHDPAQADRFDRLDELISAQAYRLSSWRVAGEEINYRRFFDVNTLAAIRMELPEVFAATHQLLFALADAGHLAGVRIDHIDGLALPGEYLARLRERVGPAFFIAVEKILGPDEKLRADWPVQGTTGYEFGNHLVQLLVSPRGVRQLAAAYDKFIGYHAEFHEIAYRGKKLVMQVSMASEVNALGQLLNRISESHRWFRDFTVNALTNAVREVIACFPVYRTYLDPAQPAEETDIRVLSKAIGFARRRNPAMERTVFNFLRDVLLAPKENAHRVDETLRAEFVLKFQQCTGPITAKGVEDTAFYVFNRVVALNEVGGEPSSAGLIVEAFHRANAARLAQFPQSLLATSTHDTKRSEDVRARLATLSEMPEEWSRAVRRWQIMNRKHRRELEGEPAPAANEEYLLYQTLVGAWPLEGLHEGNRGSFVTRIQDYMAKALHEAKVNTSWMEPNAAWDEAVREFIAAILAPAGRNRFPHSVASLAERVAEIGAVNSLTQTILKLTCPGVPDFYQGSELWDFSLVDPDNRRPVDYSLRQHLRENLADASPVELFRNWRDGRIKLFITQRLLALRQEHPAVFAQGEYVALQTTGAFAEHAIAFERRDGPTSVLVLVPRLTGAFPSAPTGKAWGDTAIAPPAPRRWRNYLTGDTCEAEGALAQLLPEIPFAILVEQK